MNAFIKVIPSIPSNSNFIDYAVKSQGILKEVLGVSSICAIRYLKQRLIPCVQVKARAVSAVAVKREKEDSEHSSPQS
jgi:hypothetical protein